MSAAACIPARCSARLLLLMFPLCLLHGMACMASFVVSLEPHDCLWHHLSHQPPLVPPTITCFTNHHLVHQLSLAPPTTTYPTNHHLSHRQSLAPPTITCPHQPSLAPINHYLSHQPSLASLTITCPTNHHLLHQPSLSRPTITCSIKLLPDLSPL